MYVATTEMLICTVVFAYAKSRFSHDTALIIFSDYEYSMMVYSRKNRNRMNL